MTERDEAESALKIVEKCIGWLNEYDAEIAALKAERDEWKNKYLMKISEPVGK